MALNQLGYQSTKFNWTGSWPLVPTGCSIRINPMHHQSHFEISPFGVGRGRDDLTPICKNSSISGKFCYMQYSMSS